ncbi:MAG: Flagellar hook-length control protein FliK [Myxococcales bacterium]|nr:Flagellar hook-length control protein FliK [Myxococcales bacterium]
MRSTVIAWGLALAACGQAADEPRLDAIEPALVTGLIATPAIVHGSALDAQAQVDLDSHAPARIDRGWQIWIDDVAVADATWIDRESLSLTIPRGLAPGAHDVIARGPRGVDLRLDGALVVTADPIGLTLSIEDAPGGTGHPVSAVLTAGTSLVAYAVVRDPVAAFVADVPVQWSLSSPIGTLGADTASSVTLLATTVGVGQLHAQHTGAATEASSDVTVSAGVASQIGIVDAPGGAANVIGDVASLTTDSDGGLTAFAASFDAFGNYTGGVPVVWSLSGAAASFAATGTTTAVDFQTPGTAVLRGTHPMLGAATTGTLTIVAGRAASLAISPSSLATTADAAATPFAATATDGDGNPTTNLGVLDWSVASGPITSISPASGVLDPIRAGTGTLRVTSSHGPTAVSGTITIAPGAANQLTIAPDSITVDADAPPVAFQGTATDADGNIVASAPTWSILSGPISAIDSSTGLFDPRKSGTGTIAARLGTLMATATVNIAPGKATSIAVVPDQADLAMNGSPLAFSVAGLDADGNATSNGGTVTWSIVGGGTMGVLDSMGVLTPTTPGIGRIRATSSYGPTDDSGTVRIRRQATLDVTIGVATPISPGGQTTVTMTVTNSGEIGATSVAPCALQTSSGLALVNGPSPTTTAIPPGASATFTWSISAASAGPAQVTSCATGIDAQTSSPIMSTAAVATFTVSTGAALIAALRLPAFVGRGAVFTVSMDVTNTGDVDAAQVVPDPPTFTTGAATVVTSPSPGVSSLAAGATAQLAWTYRATAVGVLTIASRSTGTDVGNNQPIASAMASATTSVVERQLVMADPFGDGSASGLVTSYRGRVYVGPNEAGVTAVSFLPDGTGGQTSTFLFARDTNSNQHKNTSVPYHSLGSVGCVANTAACGPDNENGRGVFTAVTLGGTEWLVAQSARDTKDLDYAYMTTDTDAELDFRYVDLQVAAPGEAFGASATAALGTTLYLGAIGKGSAGPTLLALNTAPPAPGIDATSSQLVDLEAGKIPGMLATVGTMEKIDAFGALGGLLYLANPGAWARATVATPRPYSVAASDWTVITPSTVAYAQRTSRTTTKLTDLEPADRAVADIAVFGGRVFVGRNTTAGPQLWACDPAATGTTTQCETGDWSLIARNSTGDLLLTQFDDPALSSISMVVATEQFLYVGFDSPGGLHVFRTASATASSRADFEGAGGCSAASHPASCESYGGIGLGDLTSTRIFDAALVGAGQAAVWMTVGNGTSPVKLVMLP